MSWLAVLALCAAAYALKAAGLLLAGRVDAATAERWSLELMVVPVLAALILVQTVDGGRGHVTLDARLPALLVAAVLVWRRAPLLVVVLAAGATAALLRL